MLPNPPAIKRTINAMQQIRDTIATEFDAVNQRIIAQLHSNVPLAENIGHYIVDAGGKRLRPILVLLAGGACNNINDDHISLAAIIEFIHTATLLHDDVVDISSLRRGRPTANAEWGNASSVLVGDFLYTRAFQQLVAIDNMAIMKLMADTTNIIAEGEVLQLSKAGDPSTTEQQYFQVIENKTAVLFAAATAGGAMLAGASSTDVDQYYQYGLKLGLAFQLIDDVLDYEGDPSEMGKNIGDDLAEGKSTLPLIYTMAQGTQQQRQLIASAIATKSKDQLDAIINAVQTSGGLAYARQLAHDHSSNAIKALGTATATPHRDALVRLTELALSRTS